MNCEFARCRAMSIEEMSKSYSSEFEKRAMDITALMQKEIVAELRARFQAELNEEIAVTTASLQEKEAELADAAGNDAFNLGLLLKLKTERLELACYLRGLQFCASKAEKP
jgi:hypothetical protein